MPPYGVNLIALPIRLPSACTTLSAVDLDQGSVHPASVDELDPTFCGELAVQQHGAP
jgi:hypothetical protein